MNFNAGRDSVRERQRIQDLMAMVPSGIENALDAGSRDGHLAAQLLTKVKRVTAMDLLPPTVEMDPRVVFEIGDITSLGYRDDTYDLVLCSEVLEHIPGANLIKACQELERVSNRYLLIGVPYQQDLRQWQLACGSCGQQSPPWGHVNSFDEKSLKELFPRSSVVECKESGSAKHGTNSASTWLFRLAGNPYGSYEQLESCVHCGEKIFRPPPMTTLARFLAKVAVWIQALQNLLMSEKPLWIHILLLKNHT